VLVRGADHDVLLRAIDMQELSCSCAFVQIRLASFRKAHCQRLAIGRMYRTWRYITLGSIKPMRVGVIKGREVRLMISLRQGTTQVHDSYWNHYDCLPIINCYL
jgi:hypothetical protein